jgi:hypothetical protein
MERRIGPGKAVGKAEHSEIITTVGKFTEILSPGSSRQGQPSVSKKAEPPRLREQFQSASGRGVFGSFEGTKRALDQERRQILPGITVKAGQWKPMNNIQQLQGCQ